MKLKRKVGEYPSAFKRRKTCGEQRCVYALVQLKKTGQYHSSEPITRIVGDKRDRAHMSEADKFMQDYLCGRLNANGGNRSRA